MIIYQKHGVSYDKFSSLKKNIFMQFNFGEFIDFLFNFIKHMFFKVARIDITPDNFDLYDILG